MGLDHRVMNPLVCLFPLTGDDVMKEGDGVKQVEDVDQGRDDDQDQPKRDEKGEGLFSCFLLFLFHQFVC